MNLVRLKDVAILEYGSALDKSESLEKPYLAFGSNGSFSKSPIANTNGETIIVGRKGSFGKVNYSFDSIFCTDTTYFMDSTKTSEDLRFMYYVLQTLNLDSVSADVGVPGLSRNEAYLKKFHLPNKESQKKIASKLDLNINCIEKQLTSLNQKLIHLDEYKTALIHNAVTKGLDAKGCRILDGTPAAEMKWKDSGVEWIGEVPEGWDVSNLKSNISNIQTGGTPASSNEDYYSDVGNNWACIGDMSRKMYFDDSAKKLTDEAVLNKGLSFNRVGDVMYAIYASVGEACIVKVPTTTNQAILSITPSSHITTEFLYFYLISAKKSLVLYTKESTQLNLNQETVKNFKFPVPDSREASAISVFLTKYCEKAELAKQAINKKIALLLEYKKSLINEAVSGEMVVQERMIREKC